MKALDWQKFFAEQRELHGKVVFSVAELANAGQTTLHALNTELGRLVARGMVARYAQGRYGPAEGVGPEDLVPAIDPGAYITGFYALFRLNLVTQGPAEVTCFTNRRHNRRDDRVSPAGKLRWIGVPAGVYDKPRDQVIAPGEQALCDFIWLNLREGVDSRHLVTFMHLERLRQRPLERTLQRYPDNVREVVEGIVSKAYKPSANWGPSGLRKDAVDNSGPSSDSPTFRQATWNIR